jgi:hypothetical protein
VSIPPELLQRAADPDTPAQELADLAAAHAGLRATIALNPATYEGLLDWLRQYGDADVQAALAARAHGGASSAPPPPPPVAAPVTGPPPTAGSPPVAAYAPTSAPAAVGPTARWIEPSRSLPVSGLGYDQRYLVALAALGLAGLLRVVIVPLALPAIDSAIFSAPLDVSASSALYWFVDFLLAALASALVAVAILVLPSVRSRKTIAVLLAAAPIAILLLQSISMIVVNLAGGDLFDLVLGFFSFLTLLFFPAAVAAWLVVRLRPAISFAVLPIAILPIALIVAFNDNPGYYYGFSPTGALLTLLMILVLVGIAWLGRLLAAQQRPTPQPLTQPGAPVAPRFPAPPGQPGGPPLRP